MSEVTRALDLVFQTLSILVGSLQSERNYKVGLGATSLSLAHRVWSGSWRADKPVPADDKYCGHCARAESPVEVADNNTGEENAPVSRADGIEASAPEIHGRDEGVLKRAKRKEDEEVAMSCGPEDNALPPGGIREGRESRQAANPHPVDSHPFVDDESHRALDERERGHDRAAVQQAEPIDDENVKDVVAEEIECSVDRMSCSHLREAATVAAKPSCGEWGHSSMSSTGLGCIWDVTPGGRVGRAKGALRSRWTFVFSGMGWPGAW